LSINKHVIDELLLEFRTPEQILGRNGLIKQLTKAVLERALDAELAHHLREQQGQAGLEAPESAPEPTRRNVRNVRNGHSRKTIRSEHGQLTLEIPRDREASFEPVLVPKHQRRLAGLDEKIIGLYACGMSDRDISRQIQDLYGVELSASLISEVTDAVTDEVTSWQARALERIYPIVYLDALVIKVRSDKRVINKSVHLAIGVREDGMKEALGFWMSETEGAKFWLGVLTELKNRGLHDILIACVDGLKGFPEAIESVYPRTRVQGCIVHLVRHSLNYVSFKQRRPVAAALKVIYSSATIEEAELALDAFEREFGQQFPAIVRSWRANWQRVIPMFEYAPEIRRIIYTTNTIESVNSVLRRSVKTKGSFPSDDAAKKILYLSLMNATRRWTMPIREWRQALNQLTILHPERLTTPNLL
jgi:putative transposase